MSEFTYTDIRETLDKAYANGITSRDEDNIWRAVDLARRLSDLLVATADAKSLTGSEVDDFFKLFYAMSTSRFDLAVDKVIKSLKNKRRTAVRKQKEQK